MKGDARNGDCGVENDECCTFIGQSAAAIKYGGGWDATDDKRCNIADVDCGLVEYSGTQGHERSADGFNSVGDGFAGWRHITN